MTRANEKMQLRAIKSDSVGNKKFKKEEKENDQEKRPKVEVSKVGEGGRSVFFPTTRTTVTVDNCPSYVSVTASHGVSSRTTTSSGKVASGAAQCTSAPSQA